MNVAKVGTATCKSRAVLKALAALRWEGHHRCHGEEERMSVRSPESVLEFPVRNASPARGIAARVWLGSRSPTGRIRNECATTWSRNGGSSAQPGIEPIACSIKGLLNEQGNFASDAWRAKPGKPPSPAMFRAEDGALVVVRARESRAHGEGEQ